MSRVVHFEIPARDVEKMKNFYTGVLGWKFVNWGGGEQDYWLITTGEDGTPGINGGFSTPEGPFQTVVNTVDVEDLDDVLVKLLANGGEIIFPKDAVRGVGWLAYARDPEGNVFGMMQADTGAGMETG